jgi:hypothetical protein
MYIFSFVVLLWNIFIFYVILKPKEPEEEDGEHVCDIGEPSGVRKSTRLSAVGEAARGGVSNLANAHGNHKRVAKSPSS